ncbi:WGR domain-containing protein, predicted DNA-binding domain in MolR [Filimonas lacunae]|uniref:WGR domain-containing protein, predicted DNA-binding domain in MolR n=1 Tax=Filimonas lacunae TaxID=477680 RepID=A0A173MEU9_9BACT|nr:hypothetical protein [Filimonas lacunae]BAV05958.1 hypothetical protein FLA_1973 [Filimonas lacunae]SIT23928.1 WGR domain-containing protein, predicted DNA-binding domain in MolR [Filimonas lacunae]
MMQYFEFQNGSSFLEITQENTTIKTRCGQKGTEGTITEQVFQDTDTATQEYNRLVQEQKKDDSYYFILGDYRL